MATWAQAGRNETLRGGGGGGDGNRDDDGATKRNREKARGNEKAEADETSSERRCEKEQGCVYRGRRGRGEESRESIMGKVAKVERV